MFDPLDFFYLARELHFEPIEPESASIRSSISRAYYAAFLVAREQAGLSHQETDIHNKVVTHFRDKQRTMLANRLSQLKRQRHEADYKLEPRDRSGNIRTLSSRDTGNAIRLANDIIAEFGIALTPRS